MPDTEGTINRAVGFLARKYDVKDKVMIALLNLAMQHGYHIRWEEQCDQEQQQLRQKTAEMLSQLNDAIEKWRPSLTGPATENN